MTYAQFRAAHEIGVATYWIKAADAAYCSGASLPCVAAPACSLQMWCAAAQLPVVPARGRGQLLVLGSAWRSKPPLRGASAHGRCGWQPLGCMPPRCPHSAHLPSDYCDATRTCSINSAGLNLVKSFEACCLQVGGATGAWHVSPASGWQLPTACCALLGSARPPARSGLPAPCIPRHYSPAPLPCQTYKDTSGVCTIGWGHSAKAPTPPRPDRNTAPISAATANTYLKNDLAEFEKTVSWQKRRIRRRGALLAGSPGAPWRPLCAVRPAGRPPRPLSAHALYTVQVRSYVKVPLTSNQFSALVSWTFNGGVGTLSSSRMLANLNRCGDWLARVSPRRVHVHMG